jgi:hypothetical protein
VSEREPAVAVGPRGAAARLRHALPHLVMLAAAVFLYWSAGRIDAYTGGGARIGPDAWPKAIIVLMGLLCAFEAGRRLLGRGTATGAPASSVFRPPTEPAPAAGMLAAGVLLVAAYVLAVPWLGFFLTTAIFLAVFPWMGGLRRPVLCAVLGGLGSFVLVVLFMRVAYISLPLGEGPFRTLSLALLEWIGVK